MLEYFVLRLEQMEDGGELISSLNELAQDGWHVVCNTIFGLVLEREKRPVVVEADGKVIITYDWGSTSQELPHDSE